MNTLIISGSPHVHGRQSTCAIMWTVVIALLPALAVSIFYFGISALYLSLLGVASCMLFEYIIGTYMLRHPATILDGSAVITGLLMAFNVPSSLPWWQLILGCLFAIGIAKMPFGGLGKNPFNPALVGRVFLLISFPVDMTQWPVPQAMGGIADAVTGPTALGVLKEGLMKGEHVSQLMQNIPSYQHLLIGHTGGSLGEVSALALLLGGLFMLWRKVISWHIPVSFLFSAFLFSGILWMINPERYADPIFHLLAGGMILGAVYMATDIVTSPMTHTGMLIFGVCCGLLTIIIRVWGAYPEGVSFAILIMNAFTPLINNACKPKRFGEESANE